jgi:hypothetical protein
MKRKLLVVAMFAVAALAVGATPASAQITRESGCMVNDAAASVEYDCNFNVKNYVTGTPVMLDLAYTCTGTCGPVMSFGLGDRAWTPAGVSGRLTGGRRMASGLQLVFTFDTLKKTGAGGVGNAQFVMVMLVGDGAGGFKPLTLPIRVHLIDN